ncbi:MAG: hypothetical protein ACJA02_000929 [Myxococcota bacterium]|jgi:hypothetical protein
MRSDKLLASIINFLVPIIFIYAFFELANYVNRGLFSFIYAVILVAIALFIHSMKYPDFIPSPLILKRLMTMFGIVMISYYLIFILFLILK